MKIFFYKSILIFVLFIIAIHFSYGMIKKDFKTFQASNCYSPTSIKTLKKINIKQRNEKIEFLFKSKSFLRNQVRSMVGCLVYVGQRKWNLKKFEKVFKSKKRKFCAPPAPAHGLYLLKVNY